jgi:5'-3' exonuclease
VMKKIHKEIFESLGTDQPTFTEERTLLVDSMNTFMRSFAAIKHINPEGSHIGGLTGFLKSIGALVRMIQPTRVILVFDGLGGSTAKRNLYPEYKANRKLTRITNWDGFETKEEESESITNQVLRLVDYLKCLPVDLLILDEVEADDAIGYLTKIAPGKLFILSTDTDYYQLIDEKVSIYSPKKQLFYTPDVFRREFSYSAKNYLLVKTMAGDSADNITGIRGLQRKTILKLFPELVEDTRFNLEDIWKWSEERIDQNKKYALILQYRKQLEINYQIINLHEVMLSEVNRQAIHSLLATPNKQLYVKEFLQYYSNDLLGNSIRNPQVWLYESFRNLTL